MVSTAPKDLNALGQSLWLDNITRDLLDKGTLAELYRDEVGHRPDLQPHDLRQRDLQEQLGTRGDPSPARRRPQGRGALLQPRDPGSLPRRRPVPADLREHGHGRWFRLPGSLAAPRLRHPGDGEAGPGAARPGRQAQPLHQDPRHPGRPARDRGGDLSPASR